MCSQKLAGDNREIDRYGFLYLLMSAPAFFIILSCVTVYVSHASSFLVSAAPRRRSCARFPPPLGRRIRFRMPVRLVPFG